MLGLLQAAAVNTDLFSPGSARVKKARRGVMSEAMQVTEQALRPYQLGEDAATWPWRVWQRSTRSAMLELTQ